MLAMRSSALKADIGRLVEAVCEYARSRIGARQL
jgi:hypothetical protein